MRRAIRLAFAMQRLELRLLLGAVLLMAVAALGIAWQMRVVRDEQLACIRTTPQPMEGSAVSPCTAQDDALNSLDRISAFIKVGIMGTPIVLGLFLGVPLVAREVESRTAPLAWTLSRSRRRWLWQRGLPVLGALTLACIAAGVAGDVLAHAPPWAEGTGPGFEDWFVRGPQVAVRGAAVAAIGLLTGAVVGRQLPAVLMGFVATIALFASATMVLDAWMADAVEPVAVQEGQIVGGKIYGSGIREDATGEILSDEAAYQKLGNALDFGIPTGYTQVYYLVPSRRYGDFVLYEGALFGIVALAGMGATTWIVTRRSP
ncbi:MAG TPA: hypothetical protein VHU77_06205 [Candidatus Limnocylindria bacterium]|jgi:hypothetical protein|nr:hypothetical protein [Candidatus Limnocylindria bacterium]